MNTSNRPGLLPGALHRCTSALAITWRFDVVGAEHLASVRHAAAGFAFGLWHESLIPLLWLHRGEGITVLVSSHHDGGLLAHVASRWGYRVLRGSSTRGGLRGLRGLVRVLGTGAEVAVTPDGPRGPSRVAKPGVLRAAALSGRPILPIAAAASPAWRIRSWDRTLIPLPFARIFFKFGFRRLSRGFGSFTDRHMWSRSAKTIRTS